MNQEELLSMNVNTINNKLKDEYIDFKSLCHDLNLDVKILKEKLKDKGYIYSEKENQFIKRN